MTDRYLIDALEVRGARISVQAHPRFRSRFLADDFHVEYDREVQLSAMDESILAIPFLLSVLPLVWISGETYRIPTLDGDLAAALDAVHDAFRNLYPRFAWDGELLPDAMVTPPAAAESTAVALLFSGGVDSVYSSLTHRGTPQRLITIESMLGVWDWDTAEARAASQTYFRGFAVASGHACSFITSNLHTFVSPAKLVGTWPDPRRWLIEVQHGLGLVGLCAPVMSRFRLHTLLEASCERDRYGIPGGSHPDLLGAVRWSGVGVSLDGADKTRQGKLRDVLALMPAPRGRLTLRPCLRPVAGFGNCCTCAKCLQTILGIVGEGVDPRPYGFPMELSLVLAALRRQVSAGWLSMSDVGELLQWQEIQAALQARIDGADLPDVPGLRDSPDLPWLARLNLASYFDRLHRGPRSALRRWRGRLGLRLDQWPTLGRAARRLLRSLP